jgi:hypothetical protein
MPNRLADIATLLVVLLIAWSTTVQGGQSTDIGGKWAGTSKVRCGGRQNRPGRCNALQNITFDFQQEGSKVSGTYTCAFGTQDCLGLHEHGKLVGGSYEGKELIVTVDMGTGATCQFKGGVRAAEGQGSYSCRGSGGAEHGTWRIHRAGGVPVPKAESIAPALRPYIP